MGFGLWLVGYCLETTEVFSWMSDLVLQQNWKSELVFVAPWWESHFLSAGSSIQVQCCEERYDAFSALPCSAESKGSICPSL